MDLEQLKLVLSMVQTVTDGAMWVLFGYIAWQVLVLITCIVGVWLVCRMIVQWVRIACHEDDWRAMRKRLYPHKSGYYTCEEHSMVVRSVHGALDAAERGDLK